jgi:hypothetical protein
MRAMFRDWASFVHLSETWDYQSNILVFFGVSELPPNIGNELYAREIYKREKPTLLFIADTLLSSLSLYHLTASTVL